MGFQCLCHAKKWMVRILLCNIAKCISCSTAHCTRGISKIKAYLSAFLLLQNFEAVLKFTILGVFMWRVSSKFGIFLTSLFVHQNNNGFETYQKLWSSTVFIFNTTHKQKKYCCGSALFFVFWICQKI